MDKKITSPGWKKQLRPLLLGSLALGGTALAYAWSHATPAGSSQHVALQGLQISAVQQGIFQDTLAVRGQVRPKTTVYLDSIAGGQVEEKLVEHGDFVQQGQPLLRLSNTALQLEVMSREAQATEQLNFLRNTQMTMETNRLNLRRDLLEIDLQIRQLQRRLKQSEQLKASNLIAADTLTQLQDDLQYFEQRKQLTLEQQRQENSVRQLQLTQLEESAQMLQSNLQLARSNLDNLLVRAPVSGYLSELNVEVGESKERGARLGQIDIPDEFKLVLQLDEFYLNQISREMPVRIQAGTELIEAVVSKVDSRVIQSQFQVEVALPKNISGIRRGQSLDAELVLGGDKTNALLLNRGAFFASTGGHWVYVVDANGAQAQRREIRLGKRNQNYFEVLEGLTAGEQVIISGYGNFEKASQLNLK
ncbi:MAG: efflux RND transporter periplasmic adaptor subunit [Rheinheimera sp.]